MKKLHGTLIISNPTYLECSRTHNCFPFRASVLSAYVVVQILPGTIANEQIYDLHMYKYIATQKWSSIVQSLCTSIWNFKYTLSKHVDYFNAM